MSNFNGKCLIQLSYRRIDGRWKLNTKPRTSESDPPRYMIDSRVREKINDAIGRIECNDLPRAENKNPEQLPFVHVGRLLSALATKKLDGGNIMEHCTGAQGTSEETYSVTIEIKERPEPHKHHTS